MPGICAHEAWIRSVQDARDPQNRDVARLENSTLHRRVDGRARQPNLHEYPHVGRAVVPGYLENPGDSRQHLHSCEVRASTRVSEYEGYFDNSLLRYTIRDVFPPPLLSVRRQREGEG